MIAVYHARQRTGHLLFNIHHLLFTIRGTYATVTSFYHLLFTIHYLLEFGGGQEGTAHLLVTDRKKGERSCT